MHSVFSFLIIYPSQIEVSPSVIDNNHLESKQSILIVLRFQSPNRDRLIKLMAIFQGQILKINNSTDLPQTRMVLSYFFY